MTARGAAALVALGALALAPRAASTAPPGAPPSSADEAEPRIVDRLLPMDTERIRLTLAYRRAHQDPAAADLAIEPSIIVIHHTGGTSAEATMRYFARPRIDPRRAQLAAAGDANVSAHFLVDRDGSIVRLLPETTFARHTIGLNHVAIGVENVGGTPRRPLTSRQLAANAALVRYLVRRFPITHLIGHHEARRLEGGPLFVELDPRYRNRKIDPGERFMSRLRARVADLGLLGAPAPGPNPATGRR